MQRTHWHIASACPYIDLTSDQGQGSLQVAERNRGANRDLWGFYSLHWVRQEEQRKLEGRDGTGRQKCFRKSQGHCVPGRRITKWHRVIEKKKDFGNSWRTSPASAVSRDVPYRLVDDLGVCGSVITPDLWANALQSLLVGPSQTEAAVNQPPSVLISPLQHVSLPQLLLFMLLMKCWMGLPPHSLLFLKGSK